MNKLLHYIILFGFCAQGVANDNYISYSAGTSMFNYDMTGRAYQQIMEKDQEIFGIISALGGDVSIKANQYARFEKIMYGRKLGGRLYFSLMYFKTGTFSIQLDADIEKNVNEKDLDLYAKGSGYFLGTARLVGAGPKLEGVFPITKRTNLVVGMGILKSKAVITTTHSIDLEYSYRHDLVPSKLEDYRDMLRNLVGADVESMYDYGTTYEEITLILPVVSFGVIYDITKNIAVKAEFERYGHPMREISIDTFTAGLQINF